MCGKPGGLGVAKHQSGACPWRRGGEPEDGGRRPSLAVFSPLKQSKPCPTQERAEEADGGGARLLHGAGLLTGDCKVHGKDTRFTVSTLIRQSAGSGFPLAHRGGTGGAAATKCQPPWEETPAG